MSNAYIQQRLLPSIKARHFYAEFDRTQRNRCACIPQLEQEETGMHSRCGFETIPVCLSAIFWPMVFVFI